MEEQRTYHAKHLGRFRKDGSNVSLIENLKLGFSEGVNRNDFYFEMEIIDPKTNEVVHKAHVDGPDIQNTIDHDFSFAGEDYVRKADLGSLDETTRKLFEHGRQRQMNMSYSHRRIEGDEGIYELTLHFLNLPKPE